MLGGMSNGVMMVVPSSEDSHESIIDRHNKDLTSILELVATSIARNVARRASRACE